ncbi:DNA topoisomerase IV subunit A [Candidatus Magnetaquicoccus inordinatus]|uniref:DNA topoisomerase IV subunit A n=1 Tax=Candidatus Magnetaquicoccus inordinatus TaxID=2496818 RepID=UPI001D0EB0EA|nr:DNA topoisomerase IV subunit A [Candidatus Magnetaquicoccus inordinatus]
MNMADAAMLTDVPIRLELESRYLAYALSTIISRSLPDVRDGLKPVHRRILFAMRGLHLDPGSAYKKSARVVGDVIGKYHPHGDQASYEAMVRLAQEFAVRYPLVDGQGNFGNVDGDSAAAMRYTEARLTRVASALLEDLDRETVDFIDTYDGSSREPLVLPARFPNLLANGSTGIAVGMSTAIPPHNVGEIVDACRLLIANPQVEIGELMRVLPGPDFPSGGVLMATEEERLELYQTGKGSLRLRSRWFKEEVPYEKGGPRGAWRLIISEIPYQVSKSRLIERIAQLILGKQSPFLADVRDESDSAIRIVLEPQSSRLDPERIMAYLFKNTDLEVRVAVNLNVITASTRPQVLNLKGLLRAWLDHRYEVWSRRSQHELAGIKGRLHLLAAYLLVHLNIDEVVAIIKEHDEPAPVLMSRFALDAEQAEAVLNLRLRALRRLEEMHIRREMAEKEARAEYLRALLADEQLLWQAIDEELQQTRKEFADPRRTELTLPPQEPVLKPEEMTLREPLTVILSSKGWVKAIRGYEDPDISKLRFKGDDTLLQTIRAYTTDTISFVSRSGKLFSILADRLPAGKGFGEPLTVLFDMEGMDPVVWAMVVESQREYLVATRLSQGFRIKGSDLLSTHRAGKQVIQFKEEDQLLHIRPVLGSMVAAMTPRMLLICALQEFPLLPRGKGVRIQRLARAEWLVDVITFNPEEGVVLDSGKRQKRLNDLQAWLGSRANRGGLLPYGFLSGATFVGHGGASMMYREEPLPTVTVELPLEGVD